jgi:hypothetical protein
MGTNILFIVQQLSNAGIVSTKKLLKISSIGYWLHLLKCVHIFFPHSFLLFFPSFSIYLFIFSTFQVFCSDMCQHFAPMHVRLDCDWHFSICLHTVGVVQSILNVKKMAIAGLILLVVISSSASSQSGNGSGRFMSGAGLWPNRTNDVLSNYSRFCHSRYCHHGFLAFACQSSSFKPMFIYYQ